MWGWGVGAAVGWGGVGCGVTRCGGARLVTLLREHCGTLSEKSVSVNVALVQELLGEMVVGQPWGWGDPWGAGETLMGLGRSLWGWGDECGAGETLMGLGTTQGVGGFLWVWGHPVRLRISLWGWRDPSGAGDNAVGLGTSQSVGDVPKGWGCSVGLRTSYEAEDIAMGRGLSL